MDICCNDAVVTIVSYIFSSSSLRSLLFPIFNVPLATATTAPTIMYTRYHIGCWNGFFPSESHNYSYTKEAFCKKFVQALIFPKFIGSCKGSIGHHWLLVLWGHAHYTARKLPVTRLLKILYLNIWPYTKHLIDWFTTYGKSSHGNYFEQYCS